MTLKNQTVVIIGGSSGIGLATAGAALDEEANVVIASRSKDNLKKANQQLGGRALTHVVDLSDSVSLEKLFDDIGALNHLFISAAEPKSGLLTDTKLEDIRPYFDARFWGTYRATQLAAQKIAEDGSIIYMSGNAAVKGIRGSSVGAASVAAVEAFARCAAVELAPIRVNVIRAGFIDTPLLDRYGDNRQKIIDSYAKRMPLKRVGSAMEVAGAAIYLMKNTYTTGTVLEVDGGALLI